MEKSYQAISIAAQVEAESKQSRTPQEEPPAPTKKPAVERRPRAVVRWPEVRERVFARQVQIEQDGKKSKKILHYAGPRVSGYLYVGPGHVRRLLTGRGVQRRRRAGPSGRRGPGVGFMVREAGGLHGLGFRVCDLNLVYTP